jgi:hypothetical protein
VGTYFLTQSHPEKNSCDFEGLTLPGLVEKKIRKETDEAHQLFLPLEELEVKTVIIQLGMP